MITSVMENRVFGRGNRWLKLQILGKNVPGYEPGSVVGLSFRQDNVLLRHAYTISRADLEHGTLEFLYRVIPHGRMTPPMAALLPGAEIQVSGLGGHPISGEVATDPAGIVLVSTGTGIGPIFGYSQLALEKGCKLPIKLFAGFRELEDSCLQEELKALAEKHPNFEWHFSLSKPPAEWTGLRGHVTESIPTVLGEARDLHFHLVGNGNMVVELYEVLMALGLKDERVTSEVYFNYPDHLDEKKMQALTRLWLNSGRQVGV